MFCITYFWEHLSVVSFVAEYSMYPIFMFFYMVFHILVLRFYILYVVCKFLSIFRLRWAISRGIISLEPCFCTEKVAILGTWSDLCYCWKVLNFFFFVELCNLIDTLTGWLALLFICQGFREMGVGDPLDIYLFKISIFLQVIGWILRFRFLPSRHLPSQS